MMAVMGEMFGELVRYRGLLAMLAWRDIRVRYKQSVLGVAWAFLMPLIQTLVLWAIIQFGPMKIDAADRDFMPPLLFVLSGVIPWTLFNSTLSASVESLTRNSRLVTKIYFPREVFPLGTVAGAIVGFALTGVIAGALVPLSFGAAGDVLPSRSDEIIARVNLFNYAGAILGTVIVGVVADQTGFGLAFLIPLVILVLVLPATRALRKPNLIHLEAPQPG